MSTFAHNLKAKKIPLYIRAGILRFTCALALCGLLPSIAQAQRTIVISDIDDTIQLTQMKAVEPGISGRSRHAWNFAIGILKFDDAFTAIAPLYTFLADNQIEIQYVSGAPQAISFVPERFLQESQFPTGALSLKPSTKDSTEEFKVSRISRIMLDNPDAQFILIGDNGERDVRVYDRIRQDARFSARVIDVYIHRLYDDQIGLPLTADQKPYLTAADLALQLQVSGHMAPGQTAQIVAQVNAALQSKTEKVRELTLPSFAPILASDLALFDTQARELPQDAHQTLILNFLDRLRTRAIPINSASTSVTTSAAR